MSKTESIYSVVVSGVQTGVLECTSDRKSAGVHSYKKASEFAVLPKVMACALQTVAFPTFTICGGLFTVITIVSLSEQALTLSVTVKTYCIVLVAVSFGLIVYGLSKPSFGFHSKDIVLLSKLVSPSSILLPVQVRMSPPAAPAKTQGALV